MTKITLDKLHSMKRSGEKIAALTSYDSSFTALMDELGIELILVGDSLGVLVSGFISTVPVTMAQMIYHTEAVRRGNKNCHIIADMPFQSYATPEKALENAALLLQAGAESVKLEGGAWLAETIFYLTKRGIPVCAHLGLSPQYVYGEGGYHMHEKKASLVDDALALTAAGAALMILKCVDYEVTKEISEKVRIPVVGIGAGPHCDGQLQILYDLLGFRHQGSTLISSELISESPSEDYTRDFLQGQSEGLRGAIVNFISAVKKGRFP